MSLRGQAAVDARAILEDTAAFAVPIMVTNPQGVTQELLGLTKDIAQTIDPETGVVVASRDAAVTLPIARLYEYGMGLPKGVPDRSSKPWVVSFFDPSGVEHTFKVYEARPDQTLGVVVCKLEAYRAGA